MLGLIKKWRAKKEKEIADKIRKEILANPPQLKSEQAHISVVTVVQSLDSIEYEEYKSGNPYVVEQVKKLLATELGNRIIADDLCYIGANEYKGYVVLELKAEVVRRY